MCDLWTYDSLDVNFPCGVITEVVIKHFGWKKCIGLCNVSVISMMNELKVIGMEPSELHYKFAGLNHLHWHKVFNEEGKEITGQLIRCCIIRGLWYGITSIYNKSISSKWNRSKTST